MLKIITWFVIGSTLLGLSTWVGIKVFGLDKYEQAIYKVVKSQGRIEIRDYAPMIVAEGEFTGERKEAINKGFMVVASYIFGKNVSTQKVPMTVPILQQQSEKIPMTVPIMQAKSQNNTWTLSFVMPHTYTLKTLPTPSNSEVKLREIPAKRFAVIQFSGTWTQSNLDKHLVELQKFIASENLTTLSTPVYAFFNRPWTPWFMKRNEIMIEIVQN
jgi:effector-binding domain-containing protein